MAENGTGDGDATENSTNDEIATENSDRSENSFENAVNEPHPGTPGLCVIINNMVFQNNSLKELPGGKQDQ